jgi:hypothetical protein
MRPSTRARRARRRAPGRDRRAGAANGCCNHGGVHAHARSPAQSQDAAVTSARLMAVTVGPCRIRSRSPQRRRRVLARVVLRRQPPLSASAARLRVAGTVSACFDRSWRRPFRDEKRPRQTTAVVVDATAQHRSGDEDVSALQRAAVPVILVPAQLWLGDRRQRGTAAHAPMRAVPEFSPAEAASCQSAASCGRGRRHGTAAGCDTHIQTTAHAAYLCAGAVPGAVQKGRPTMTGKPKNAPVRAFSNLARNQGNPASR